MFTIEGPNWSRSGLRLLALDLDDTLLDHSGAAAHAAVLLAASLQLGHDDAASVWLAAEREHFPRYERGECSWEDQRRLRIRDFVSMSLTDSEADDIFQQYLTEYERGWALYPDAERLLARLGEAGIPVAVLTNGHLDQQRRKLQAIGWDHPTRLVASSAMGASKPHPEFYTAAARDASVSVSQILMIGNDEIRDIDGAVNAGCCAAHLDRSDLRIRDPRIHSLDELEIH